jgi:hypothetical protein
MQFRSHHSQKRMLYLGLNMIINCIIIRGKVMVYSDFVLEQFKSSVNISTDRVQLCHRVYPVTV